MVVARKYLTVLAFFFAVHLSLLRSQTLSTVTYPDITCTNPGQCGNTEFIHSSFYDTLNEVLYICGDFNDANSNIRRKVAAIDLRNGTVLPWNPIINNGRVNAITKTGNTVYIGGTFTQVNSVAKNYLAAMDATTGALLAWNPNPNAAVTSLFTNGTYLFVGGNFTTISAQAHNYLVDYVVATNVLHTWQPPLTASFTNLEQVQFYNNKIYFRSDNSFGGKAIFSQTFSSGGASSIMDASTDSIFDYSISNNKIYCVGDFTSINGQSRSLCAGYNIATSTLLTWNPVLPYFAPSRYQIEMHNDTAIIGCYSYATLDSNYHYIKKFSTVGVGNYINAIKYYQTDLYNPHGTYLGNILSAKDKFIEMGKEYFHAPYTNDFINVYCFKPNIPNAFTASSSQACQGTTGIIYTLQYEPGFISYAWSYSGTGATIIGNSNSVTINFSSTATSGTISVRGINCCGLQGPARTLAIIVNPAPQVNAGIDQTITCSTNQVQLNGSSTTGNPFFQWNGPNSFSSTISNPTTNFSGNYILTVTEISTGCINKDTMIVNIDTIKPTINSFTGNFQVTCLNSSVVLDGSTINVNDSLRWTGPSNFSSADPATISNSNNYYLLTAIDRNNGCMDRDSVFVSTNNVPPTISIPSSIDTITCLMDTIILNGSSTNLNAILFWTDTNNDTLQNPANVLQGGSYLLTVVDTTSGCVSSGTVIVQQNTTIPQLVMPQSNYFLNCSSSTIQITGISLTPNAIFLWNGPNSFSSGNPANVTQTGNYYLTVTDPANGCTKIDSVNVGYQPTLSFNSITDTLICNGSSVSITTLPIGASPPINYLWNTNSTTQTISISPNDTTVYIVNVTDGNGCTGTDTISVIVPAIISDSVLTFAPCDTSSLGQIQIYPYGGILPYSYSIDNGNTFQSSQIFSNLSLGNYNFIIKDSLGCTATISASINASSQLPRPDFLVSTNMMMQDTFVIVDISNPRPDSIHWNFPSSCTVINTDIFSPEIVNSDTGTFSIGMNAYYGACMLTLTKNIYVHPYDTSYADPYNNNGIQNVTLFPNPNNGQFSVSVQLYKKQTFAIFVYDENGIEHYRQTINEADNFSGNVNLQNPLQGTYVLKVIAEYDAKEKLFVISQ